VRRLYSEFPVAPPGLGLLVLRVVSAVFLVLDGASAFTALADMPGSDLRHIAHGTISIALAMFVALGLLTSIVNSLAVAIELAAMAASVLGGDDPRWQTTVLQIAIAVALVCTGPGAYSIDTRLFGRIEVVMMPRTAPNGSSPAPRK
jgi:uncharacterized membrane protein YphA (DoxX/SURF4 family)